MKNKILFLLLLLFGTSHIFAQEWMYSLEQYTSDTVVRSYVESYELNDGSIALSGALFYRSGVGDFYTTHPHVALLSENGTLLAQKDFFRPGYWGSTEPYLLQDEDDNLFALMSYSPDHDSTYFNYFLNLEDPPTDAIIGLYKLDKNLDPIEIYEHSFVIDTFENNTNQFWNLMPQEHSGNIYIYSAFVDEDNIVGVYSKTSTYCPSDPRDHDSVFFFRMDFQGNFLDKVGYESFKSGISYHMLYRRHHMVKSETGYHYFVQSNCGLIGYGAGAAMQGTVLYLDEHFNILNYKQFKHYNIIPNNQSSNTFYNIAVSRSHRNTTYLATSARSKDDPGHDEDCRLYEYDDSFNTTNTIPILNYVERATPTWDTPAPSKAVEVAEDGTVYFAYTLNDGYMNNLDSWIMIERLTPDLETIDALYYDLGGENDGNHSSVTSITTTNDGGVLMAFSSRVLGNSSYSLNAVAKFPAQAFDNIDEAHDNGLKLAVAYPNPGGNTLNIRTGLENAYVEVYDALGRMMHSQAISEEVTAINARGWPSGVYVWKVFTGVPTSSTTLAETGKWVKE
ncbi:MAG: T9SS type A sorting domain-containing protein [Bacteroidales bacterium]|jgi:hypothetical protein|nr:T9SS type A sorting domain-containing protein [Bacteroidales bacterium]MBR6931630.1 T9SS type A sorting domain-containing protein [Bacteroidales bacterium]